MAVPDMLFLKSAEAEFGLISDCKYGLNRRWICNFVKISQGKNSETLTNTLGDFILQLT